MRPTIVWGDMNGTDRFLQTLLRIVRLPVFPIIDDEGGVAPLQVSHLAEQLAAYLDEDMSAAPVRFENLQGPSKESLEAVLRHVLATYVGKRRLAIKGQMGESLLNFLDRPNGKQPENVRLRDFLTLACPEGQEELIRPMVASRSSHSDKAAAASR